MSNGKHLKIKSTLEQKHSGFAISLEVIATLIMMCVFLNMTLYVLRVMNVQRYMNTVLTATATQASRWGGVDTKAYYSNVSNTPLLASAQEQLTAIAPDFNTAIAGSPDKITENGQGITITILYSLPSVFSTLSKVNGNGDSYDMYDSTRDMHISVTVDSIMEAGKLL